MSWNSCLLARYPTWEFSLSSEFLSTSQTPIMMILFSWNNLSLTWNRLGINSELTWNRVGINSETTRNWLQIESESARNGFRINKLTQNQLRITLESPGDSLKRTFEAYFRILVQTSFQIWFSSLGWIHFGQFRLEMYLVFYQAAIVEWIPKTSRDIA